MNNNIDANDLVYSKNPSNGITSAGFNINSAMMKFGIPPLTTFNDNLSNSIETETETVANLFANQLVVPYLYMTQKDFTNIEGGGNSDKKYMRHEITDDEDDTVDDDLHDRLLDLVKEHDKKKDTKALKKKLTRKPRIKITKTKTKKCKSI